jgi:hypothetical protein
LSIAPDEDGIGVAEGTHLPAGDHANRDAFFFLNLKIKPYGGFIGTESNN